MHQAFDQMQDDSTIEREERSMEEMDENARRQLSHELHNESKRLLEKKRSGLSNVVIAIISMIIGLIFLPLSYKMVKNRIEGINYASLSFILMCIFLGIGLILFVYGLVTTLVASSERRNVDKKIRQLQDETK